MSYYVIWIIFDMDLNSDQFKSFNTDRTVVSFFADVMASHTLRKDCNN